jgi:galactonate dehydratase
MHISAIDPFPVFNGARYNLFVTVDTDAGISGVGESGLSGRELGVIGAVEHFKSLLIGQDPERIEYIRRMLMRGAFVPANRVLRSAMSGAALAIRSRF